MAHLVTEPALNTPYFTPAQRPPAGTAAPGKDGKPVPSLFQPIKIRGLELHNRLFVAPMGMSSADYNGSMTPFHTAIVGAVITRGPGLTILEAHGVTPEGRGTVHDCGLWSDEHIEPLRVLVEFAHSQGQRVGIQLSHSGRKGSIAPLWISDYAALPKAVGGWAEDLVGPTSVPYGSAERGENQHVPKPRELTTREVKELVTKWAAAAERAVKAGIDVIELHAGHGLLLHQFLSPVTNTRTDEYGGSWENRARIAVEIVDAIRKVIPDTMPLFFRPSATDWLEKVLPPGASWSIEDTVRLAGLLAEHGVDLFDVSSGGLDPRQKLEFVAPAYQAHFAEAVKKAHGDRILVGAVGGINTGKMAQEVLDKGQADVILVGSQFLKDPATVATFAEDLGVEVKMPNQIEWTFRGRGSIWRWK